MSKLIYQDPDTGSQVVVELSLEMPEVTIGRNPGNIIRINNPSVSRRHTKFVYEDGYCTLYDLNSSNGTYVNGMRIQSQVLEDGDLVRVGEFPLEYAAQSTSQGNDVQGSPIESMASATAMGMGFEGNSAATEASMDYDDSSLDHAFVLGDEDLQEVIAADELYPSMDEDSFSDETIDGGAEIAASLAQLRSAEQQGAPPPPASDHTQRADGHALSLQSLEQAIGTGEQPRVEPVADLDEERRLREQIASLEERNEELTRLLDSGTELSEDMQVKRLRGERDRLGEERKNLMRQIDDLRASLASRPSDEDLLASRTARDEALAAAHELEAMLEESRSVADERSGEIASLLQQREELQVEVEVLREELHNQQRSQEAVASKHSQLGGEVAELQGHLSETTQNLEAAEAKIQAQLQELAEQASIIESQQEQIAQAEARGRELDESLSNLRADLDLRTERIEALVESLAKAETDRDQARNAIEELEAELSRRPPADEAAALVDELETIKGQLASVTEERDGAHGRIAELETEQAERERFISDIEARHRRVSEERDSLAEERDSFKQEKAAYARETDYLQIERRKQADELTALKEKVGSFEKERKKKRKIFAELSSDLRKLVEANEGLVKEVEELTQALETAPSSDTLQELNAAIAERDELLSELETQIEELENDSSTLTRDLGEIGEERERLAQKVASLEEELEYLQQSSSDGDDLSGQLAEIAEAKRTLEEQNQALSTELDELKADNESLRERLEEEGAPVDDEEAAAKIEALQAQVASLQQELETAESQAGEEGGAGGDSEELEQLVEEKRALEETLAEIILERDRLEDELRQAKEATA